MVRTGQSLSKCNAEYKSDTKGSTKGHQAKNVQIYRRICNIYISNIYIYMYDNIYIYMYDIIYIYIYIYVIINIVYRIRQTGQKDPENQTVN